MFAFIRNLCPKRRSTLRTEFKTACQYGHINTVNTYLDKYDFDVEEAILIAVQNRQEELLKNLLSKRVKLLNECLKIAVSNNSCSMAELLVRNGAESVIGIPLSKSLNITRMLYKYENRERNF